MKEPRINKSPKAKEAARLRTLRRKAERAGNLEEVLRIEYLLGNLSGM